MHKNYFHHLSENPAFEVSPLSTPGDENSVNPGTANWTSSGFDHYAGASQRIVIEMSQPPKVYSVLAGSNQDLETNPDLAQTDSEWSRWLRCELRRQEFPLDWDRVQSQVEKVILE